MFLAFFNHFYALTGFKFFTIFIKLYSWLWCTLNNNWNSNRFFHGYCYWFRFISYFWWCYCLLKMFKMFCQNLFKIPFTLRVNSAESSPNSFSAKTVYLPASALSTFLITKDMLSSSSYKNLKTSLLVTAPY